MLVKKKLKKLSLKNLAFVEFNWIMMVVNNIFKKTYKMPKNKKPYFLLELVGFLKEKDNFLNHAEIENLFSLDTRLSRNFNEVLVLGLMAITNSLSNPLYYLNIKTILLFQSNDYGSLADAYRIY